MSTPQQGLSAAVSMPDVPITVNNYGRTGTSLQLVTGLGIITAITADNHAGTTAAATYLLDGTDTTGELLAVVTTPAANGSNVACGIPGIYFKRGIYVYLRAASQVVTVTYIPVFTPLR